MSKATFNEVVRIDSSGNWGIGTFPPAGASKLLLDFTVHQGTDGYLVMAGNNTSVTVQTYEEVEALFRKRFAEWKLEQD